MAPQNLGSIYGGKGVSRIDFSRTEQAATAGTTESGIRCTATLPINTCRRSAPPISMISPTPARAKVDATGFLRSLTPAGHQKVIGRPLDRGSTRRCAPFRSAARIPVVIDRTVVSGLSGLVRERGTDFGGMDGSETTHFGVALSSP